MKSLLFVCSFILVTISAQAANADIRAPKPPDQPGKIALHTTLEIVPDAKAYEARLQIKQSDLKELRAALDGAAGNTIIAASISQSPTRTIVAGLLMFLAVSIGGVLFARSSSFGRTQKTVVTVILLAAMLGAAAIITRGNAGPPGSYRWRNLPQALAQGQGTAGSVDIEIVPDEALTSTSMRLIIPLKKQNSPGEE
jgi:hypothetical protein